MAFSYKFSNLLGVPYGRSTFEFTQDGNALISAAGNRLVYKDLVNQQSFALGIEAPEDVDHVLICPRQRSFEKPSTVATAIMVDRSGRAILVNLESLVSLARVSLGHRVNAAAISPDGAYVAFAYGRMVSVYDLRSEQWRFVRVWQQLGHSDNINSLSWAPRGHIFVTASNDFTVKIWAVNPPVGYAPLAFVDHRSAVRYAAFSSDGSRIISVSRQGVRLVWEWTEEVLEGRENRAKDIRPSRFLKKGEELYQQRLRERYGEEEPPVAKDDEAENAEPPSKRARLNRPPSDVSRVQNGSWRVLSKDYIEKEPMITVTSCSYHADREVLAVGLSSGVVIMYEKGHEVEDGRVSFGNSPVTHVKLNNDSEWVAVGLEGGGHLAVWEWQSSTYILNDEGDIHGIRSVALMPAGLLDPFANKQGGKQVRESQDRMIGTASRNIMATGAMDGKIRLWDITSGRVLAVLPGHSSPVTSMVFTPQMNAVITAGMDGTVMAFDILKRKAFRTMSAPEVSEGVAPQINSLAMNSSGEIVAGGSHGSDCRVYLWSLQTGKLIDTLSGPEEPISAVEFSPSISKSGTLAAASQDGTVTLWDIFGRAGKGGVPQVLPGNSPAVAIAFDPRGNNKLAVSHLAGQVVLWDVETEDILGHIDGLRDIEVGRVPGQRTTADNSRKLYEKQNKYSRDANPNVHFSSITFTGHGLYLAAASHYSSKICIYNADNQQLLFSFKLTHNASLHGLLRILNSKYVNEAGIHQEELDLSDEDLDDEHRVAQRLQDQLALPGTKLSAAATASERKRLRVWRVCSSSDSRQLVVATSHGAFCYDLDLQSLTGNQLGRSHVLYSKLNSFAPILLTSETTRENVALAVAEKDYSKALRLALSLNDVSLVACVYSRIELQDISLLAKLLPPRLVPALLNFIRACLSPSVVREESSREALGAVSPMLQTHLAWLVQLLWVQSPTTLDLIGTDSHAGGVGEMRTLILMVLKELQEVKESLASLFEENRHLLDFLATAIV